MRNYAIAFIFALSITCLFAGNASAPAPMGVNLGEITINSSFPANHKEKPLGEMQIIDSKQKQKMITGISEEGAPCDTCFPMQATR